MNRWDIVEFFNDLSIRISRYLLNCIIDRMPLEKIYLIIGVKLWRIIGQTSCPVVNLLKAICNKVFDISDKGAEGNLEVGLFQSLTIGTCNQSFP